MLQDKINQIRQIQKGLNGEAKNIAKQYKSVILDYIRDNQLFDRGIDGKGNKLKPYKPFTIAIKKQKGQPTNRTTLFDTGSFTSKMDLLVTDQNAIGVFSRDEKTPDLIEKYGADIFTFTVENQKQIDLEIFETNLIKWVLSQPPFSTI